MAFAIIQQPNAGNSTPAVGTDRIPVLTNYTPSCGYMIYRSDDISAYFYYKLVMEVREDSSTGTLLAKIKQRRNGYATDVTNNYARAFFDLNEIVNSQLVPTVFDQNDTSAPFRTIHKVGANKASTILSESGDKIAGKGQMILIYIKAYESYSTSASAIPTDQTGDAVNHQMWWLKASVPLTTPRAVMTGGGLEYIQPAESFSLYRGSFATNLFLSDVKPMSVNYYHKINFGTTADIYVNFVESNDYHTLAFLNYNTGFYSNIKWIEVAYYDSDASLIGNKQYIENSATNGGDPPTGGPNKHTSLLYFGCGPKNLTTSNVFAIQEDGATASGQAKPTNFSNWKFYTIRGCSTNSNVKGGALDYDDYETVPYYFAKVSKWFGQKCKGFKYRRLAWFNSKGGYDYFSFTMKSTQTIDITRDNYESMLGTFNQDYYSYNNTGRGKTTRRTGAILRETLETDFIKEEEAQLLESLFTSIRVDVVESDDNEYTQPVVITDTSFIRKTHANDRLIQYTVNIEYANPINTNN